MSTWNRKLNLLFYKKCSSEKYLKLEPTWTLVWELRSSDGAHYETNRELETYKLELHQANQWADEVEEKR